MMRPHRFALILVAIAAAVDLMIAAGLDLSARRFRKAIPLTPSEGLAVVRLDREVYAAARPDFADLRIARDGEEVPFVLETNAAASERQERLAEIVNQSVLPSV